MQIGALVAEARAVNDLETYAVVNRGKSRANNNAIAALSTIDGVETLSAVIVSRKAFV